MLCSHFGICLMWQSGKVARAEQNLFGYAERKSLRA